MTTLFTIMLELADGQECDIGYPSIDECMQDIALHVLLGTEHVKKCAIHCGKKRIAGLGVISWERLRDSLISNSTTILRRGVT